MKKSQSFADVTSCTRDPVFIDNPCMSANGFNYAVLGVLFYCSLIVYFFILQQHFLALFKGFFKQITLYMKVRHPLRTDNVLNELMLAWMMIYD